MPKRPVRRSDRPRVRRRRREKHGSAERTEGSITAPIAHAAWARPLSVLLSDGSDCADPDFRHGRRGEDWQLATGYLLLATGAKRLRTSFTITAANDTITATQTMTTIAAAAGYFRASTPRATTKEASHMLQIQSRKRAR